MKFMLVDEIKSSSDKSVYGHFIPKITLSSPIEMQLISSLPAEQASTIVNLLNTINNQGIQDIDTAHFKYKIDNTVLPLDHLCTAERVFLIAYVADYNKVSITLCAEAKQLTKDALKKFLCNFNKSEYVNVACEKSGALHFIEYTLKEAIGEK